MSNKDKKTGFYLGDAYRLKRAKETREKCKLGVNMKCAFCHNINATYKDNGNTYCNPRCATQDLKKQLGLPYWYHSINPKCPEHGTMLCYGQHGEIRIYRCQQVWGTHKEIWVSNNGKFIEVTPHLYLKSEDGIEIREELLEY